MVWHYLNIEQFALDRVERKRPSCNGRKTSTPGRSPASMLSRCATRPEPIFECYVSGKITLRELNDAIDAYLARSGNSPSAAKQL